MINRKKIFPVAVHLLLLLSFIIASATATAQKEIGDNKFSHADSLRGTYGPARSWWDALHYNITVRFNDAEKSIKGSNIISFCALRAGKEMQIDLQQPLIIDKIVLNLQSGKGNVRNYECKPEDIRQDGNAYFITWPTILEKGSCATISLFYHGIPKAAKNAPWDGGVVWSKDKNGDPWIAVACQELGASVWYPCKDHQADEPDSAALNITVPKDLVGVGNGKLRQIINNVDSTKTYQWAVVNPINNYCIVPYVGKYVHFGETYKGLKGGLPMDYWVLAQDLGKAKAQFTQAPQMMKAFEHWFGAYPFYDDGYKLVQSPYLGMENQSDIAYGNGFINGYHGTDLSGSGWGLKWDFIIVHESGHEWFANNITTKDIADMWVHEGFTCYSETLFTEYYYGKAAGSAYLQGLRKNIKNDRPIIGSYSVNNSGSGDMYYKAASMLHMMRQVIADDEKFRQLLTGLNTTFYHQTVTSAQVEAYINKKTGKNFNKLFDQYLRTINIPLLQYVVDGYSLSFRYINTVNGFNLPLKVNFKGPLTIYPTEKWKTMNFYPEGKVDFSVDANYYVIPQKVDSLLK